MKSIEQHQEQGVGEMFRNYVADIIVLDWIFSTFLEKLIVAGSVLFTFWSLAYWVWHLF